MHIMHTYTLAYMHTFTHSIQTQVHVKSIHDDCVSSFCIMDSMSKRCDLFVSSGVALGTILFGV